MTVLSAQTIRRLGIIQPCEPRTRFRGVTYGLGPAGYDLRIADAVMLYPNTSVLVGAIEHFHMPSNVIGVLYTKSTWARMHIEVANTVVEPGWCGGLRLELSMHYGTEPLTIFAGSGVAQVVFHFLDEPTEQPYEGKYQNQSSNQNAIFETCS